jgi:hypothetical protein
VNPAFPDAQVERSSGAGAGPITDDPFSLYA